MPSPNEQDSHPARSDDFLARAMRMWGDTVYQLALTQMRSPGDADDVFQDVFLRLYRSTTAFTGAEHLKAWLLRVTINRCRDLKRMAHSTRNVPLTAQHDELPDPAAIAPATALLQSRVGEAVGELPDDLRGAIHLFYAEGYSTDEIAHIYNCNSATIRARLYRARNQLKSVLAPSAPNAPASAASSLSASPREEFIHEPQPNCSR